MLLDIFIGVYVANMTALKYYGILTISYLQGDLILL